MFEVEIVDSITDVPQKGWDALNTDDNVFISYGWLKTAEETFSGDINPRYILVKDSDELCGAAACYIFNKTELVEDLDRLLFERFEHYAGVLGISFMPGFVCCPIFGYGSHFLIKGEAEWEERKAIITELLDAIEGVASTHRLSPSFIHVTDDERELQQLLKKRRYSRAVHMPVNYIDIAWESFKEYRAHLKKESKNIDKVIRNEMNRNENEGVTIRVLEGLGTYEGRLYELLNDHYCRHTHMPLMFRRGFLGKLKEALGEDAVFYVSFKEGVITGVCILLKGGKTGYLAMVGIDHEMAGNDFTYFNIAYYRPIMDAILNQTDRLYYGRGFYRLKAKRGCVTKKIYIYYKSLNGFRNIAARLWFAFISVWYHYILPETVKKPRIIKMFALR